MTIGTGASAVHLTGWVDWRTQLIYLNSLGAKPGPSDGMLQAIPGIIAVRPGRYTPPATTGSKTVYDPYPGAAGARAADRLADPRLRAGVADRHDGDAAVRAAVDDGRQRVARSPAIGTRFVGTDEIGGDKVDVLDGAAVPPPAPKASTTGGPTAATPAPSHSGLPFAAYGGQVRYWVDAHSRLLRAEALVNPSTGLRIDFDRTDGTEPDRDRTARRCPDPSDEADGDQANVLAEHADARRTGEGRRDHAGRTGAQRTS